MVARGYGDVGGMGLDELEGRLLVGPNGGAFLENHIVRDLDDLASPEAIAYHYRIRVVLGVSCQVHVH